MNPVVLQALLPALPLLLTVAALAPASAQHLYKRVNPDGSISFTNAPTQEGYVADPSLQAPRRKDNAPSWESSGGMDTYEHGYEYDSAGRLSGTTTNGRTTTYEYDANNNLVGKRSDDSETTYEVNSENQVIRSTTRSLR